MSNTRRWLQLLRPIGPLPAELLNLIGNEDDSGIVEWIQAQLTEREREVADFKAAHHDLEQLRLRLTRRVRRQALEEDAADLDGWSLEWRVENEATQLSPDTGAQLDWYLGQLQGRMAEVRAWGRRLAMGRDFAGIEPLRDPYDPGDE